MLTDRRNVVVVADEAHRSQYGFTETLDSSGRIKAGLAKHLRDALPAATYLGFTGTPIESTDRSTRAVFGDYIDVYDLTRAVEGGRGWRRSSAPRNVSTRSPPTSSSTGRSAGKRCTARR